MADQEVSVMHKLRAIRERMAAQAEQEQGPRNPAEQPAPAAKAPPSAPAAPPSEGPIQLKRPTSQPPAPQPAAAPMQLRPSTPPPRPDASAQPMQLRPSAPAPSEEAPAQPMQLRAAAPAPQAEPAAERPVAPIRQGSAWPPRPPVAFAPPPEPEPEPEVAYEPPQADFETEYATEYEPEPEYLAEELAEESHEEPEVAYEDGPAYEADEVYAAAEPAQAAGAGNSMWGVGNDTEAEEMAQAHQLSDAEPEPVLETPEPYFEEPQVEEPEPVLETREPEPFVPAARMASLPDPEVEARPEPPVRISGRVKTRLLGIDHSRSESVDVFEKSRRSAASHRLPFPVGWVVIVSGPGRGASISIQSGVSQIGREEDQAIHLDYGDMSISRSNHASIAYDEDENAFFIGHGGKSNLVRLNGKPLLSTERLKSGDEIRIGETTLRLVTLCGEKFNWSAKTA